MVIVASRSISVGVYQKAKEAFRMSSKHGAHRQVSLAFVLIVAETEVHVFTCVNSFIPYLGKMTKSYKQ